MTEGYRALRDSAAWLALDTRGRLVVRGRDSVRFLHNIASNEVKKMAPGAGCYAFLLNAQGRIQADLHLLSFPGRFLIDTEPDLRAKVPGLILKYKVADQVELEDVTETTASIAVEGPAAAAALAACGAPVPAADCAHAEWGDSTVARLSLTDQPGFRLYGPPARRAEWISQLEAAGALPATDEDARLVRIENGKPRYGEDILDTSLPQETGQLHGVSFTKGCYLGQEIVERIRTQGHVNWKLVRLEFASSEPPSAGARLTSEGAEAGQVTSAVVSPRSGKVVALARVRSQFAEPGTALDAGQQAALVV